MRRKSFLVILFGVWLVVVSLMNIILEVLGGGKHLIFMITKVPIGFITNIIFLGIVGLLCGIGLVRHSNTARIVVFLLASYGILMNGRLLIPTPVPEVILKHERLRELVTEPFNSFYRRWLLGGILFRMAMIFVLSLPHIKARFMKKMPNNGVSTGQKVLIGLAVIIAIPCFGRQIYFTYERVNKFQNRVKQGGLIKSNRLSKNGTLSKSANSKMVRGKGTLYELPCEINGIMLSKNNSSAMINGRTYFIGDKVCGGEIINITSEGVWIQNKNGTRFYRIK